jgi:hypothetical protein
MVEKAIDFRGLDGISGRLGEAEKLFDILGEMMYFYGDIIYFCPGFQVVKKNEKWGRYLLELGSIDDDFCDIFRDMVFKIPGTLGNIPMFRTVEVDYIYFGVDM